MHLFALEKQGFVISSYQGLVEETCKLISLRVAYHTCLDSHLYKLAAQLEIEDCSGPMAKTEHITKRRHTEVKLSDIVTVRLQVNRGGLLRLAGHLLLSCL